LKDSEFFITIRILSIKHNIMEEEKVVEETVVEEIAPETAEEVVVEE
jgi:hypothetical protein